jgi:hypothetical protein
MILYIVQKRACAGTHTHPLSAGRLLCSRVCDVMLCPAAPFQLQALEASIVKAREEIRQKPGDSLLHVQLATLLHKADYIAPDGGSRIAEAEKAYMCAGPSSLCHRLQPPAPGRPPTGRARSVTAAARQAAPSCNSGGLPGEKDSECKRVCPAAAKARAPPVRLRRTECALRRPRDVRFL